MRIVPVAVSLAIAVLLTPASGTSPPASFASAVVASCAGQDATLVGADQKSLVGTAGSDVVVTGGATFVSVLGGDDLVCVTGDTEQVFAGSGDDQVHSGSDDLVVQLGAGADTFVGGPAREHVDTGDDGVRGGSDTPDDVHAGAGDDVVISGAARVDLVDTIDLGPGDDSAQLAGRVQGPDGRLTGGGGSDELTMRRAVEDPDDPPAADPDDAAVWSIVNTTTAGSARIEGTPVVSWTGFEEFVLDATAEGYRFQGGPGDEHLRGGPLLEVGMGAGDDVVRVVASSADTRLHGRQGHDRLSFTYCGTRARLLGSRHLYRCPSAGTGLPSPDRRVGVDLHQDGFEAFTLEAAAADVVGQARGEKITVVACRATVRGGGGDDRLTVRPLPAYAGQGRGCGARGRSPAVLHGGPGDDVLVGSPLDDELYGGAGHDVARGERGMDRCRAEVRVGCEGPDSVGP